MKYAVSYLLLALTLLACSPKEFQAVSESSATKTTGLENGGRGEGGRPITYYPGPLPGSPTDAVDQACSFLGAASNTAPPVLIPYVTLGAVNLPVADRQGFEINNLERNSVTFDGSSKVSKKLVIDIATYTAADTVRIYSTDATGTTKTLVHICRVRTAQYADPTSGVVRPPEDSIRRWEVTLPAGSVSLTIENTLAFTPTYVRVLGLQYNTNVVTGLPVSHLRKISTVQ